MKNLSKILTLLSLTILLTGCADQSPTSNVKFEKQPDSESTEQEDNKPPTLEMDTSSENQEGTLTIIVPEDYDAYKKAMTTYSQEGGENPLETMKFAKKILETSLLPDPIKASAEAAAAEIAPSGGPEKATVSYFKILDKTAYILLNIDIDGWAGVSVSKAIIHPLVEKTLLQFPEIEEVLFEYAPQDK